MQPCSPSAVSSLPSGPSSRTCMAAITRGRAVPWCSCCRHGS
jgi:hypothetical protein